ncbi:MAG: acetyl-CoA carboxylase biotin carboxyl carrier protein subunit [Bacteroidales bacterium]|nr:acetyl-CoA carboxylase biotin carboxyl carrier protein subunit [Bacteroidales bacterium]
MSDNNNNNENQNGQKRRFRSLMIDGTRYRTKLTEKFKNRIKWDNPHKGKVYSEFPGTVVKVDVEEGEEIDKGDRLYIYDAMKMKNRSYSPVGGTIREVRIQENDIIRKGDLLFVIE